ALTCGVRPVIGPSWENFAWVGPEIVAQGLVRVADNWQDAAGVLIADLEKSTPHAGVSQTALAYIQSRQGGTGQACRQIAAFLEKP
ncbi:MAG: hypothetical protein JSW39_21455, partial [Desulfobacterales bacterium]